MPARDSSPRQAAVLAVTGAALFMIVLDNLIVVSTLPVIQRSLHAPLSSLEWIVDAYILSFAALILSGAALGERFARRRRAGDDPLVALDLLGQRADRAGRRAGGAARAGLQPRRARADRPRRGRARQRRAARRGVGDGTRQRRRLGR